MDDNKLSELESKTDTRLNGLDTKVSLVKDDLHAAQIAILQSLGTINTGVTLLGSKLDNEIQTMKDFRIDTNKEMKGIKTKINVLEINQKLLIDQSVDNKDIKKFLRNALIGIFLSAATVLVAAFTIIKDS